MVKTVAEQRGWQDSDHAPLFDAVATIAAETGDEDIDRLFEVASILQPTSTKAGTAPAVWNADYATSRSSSTSCNRRSTSNGVAGGHRHPICQHHPRSQQFRTQRPQGTKAGKWQSCVQTLPSALRREEWLLPRTPPGRRRRDPSPTPIERPPDAGRDRRAGAPPCPPSRLRIKREASERPPWPPT